MQPMIEISPKELRDWTRIRLLYKGHEVLSSQISTQGNYREGI